MDLKIIGENLFARKMLYLSNEGTIHVRARYHMVYEDKDSNRIEFISEPYMDFTDEKLLQIVQEKLN